MSGQPNISELTAARNELIASQRQAHLGAMAAMLAHELNNLATPILARAQDALDRDDVPAMRKALAVTLKNVGKAVQIAQHLIDLARATPPAVEVCELAPLVDAALADTVRPFDRDGITLSVTIPAGLKVRTNRLLLEQMLVHLLSEIRRGIVERTGSVSISARDSVDFIEIEVFSNARSYTPEFVEESVRPWLDSACPAPIMIRDAAELPLRVCRLIGDAHQATITIVAREPHGCSFLLRWPAAT